MEDHPDTVEVLSLLLLREGHQLVTAGSVASALELARDRAIDVVVSDIGLPDGSGLELMQRLRERGNARGIALSGYGTEQDMARSRAAGFDEHLVKPVDFHTLIAAIGRLADTLQPG